MNNQRERNEYQRRFLGPRDRGNEAPHPTKQRLFGLLKVAVSIGLLALLLRSMDLAAVAGVLGRVPLWTIPAGILLLVIQTAILGLRWWLVMAAIEAPMPLRKVLPVTYTKLR